MGIFLQYSLGIFLYKQKSLPPNFVLNLSIQMFCPVQETIFIGSHCRNQHVIQIVVVVVVEEGFLHD